MQNRDIVKYYRIHPTHDGKFVFRTDSGRLAENIPSHGLSIEPVPSINMPDSWENWRSMAKRNLEYRRMWEKEIERYRLMWEEEVKNWPEIYKNYMKSDEGIRYSERKKAVERFKNIDFNKFKSDDHYIDKEIKKIEAKRNLTTIMALLGMK
jgi:hypothetical protein